MVYPEIGEEAFNEGDGSDGGDAHAVAAPAYCWNSTGGVATNWIFGFGPTQRSPGISPVVKPIFEIAIVSTLCARSPK